MTCSKMDHGGMTCSKSEGKKNNVQEVWNKRLEFCRAYAREARVKHTQCPLVFVEFSTEAAFIASISYCSYWESKIQVRDGRGNNGVVVLSCRSRFRCCVYVVFAAATQH